MKTLEGLTQEVKRQYDESKDFLADSRRVEFQPRAIPQGSAGMNNGVDLVIANGHRHEFTPTKLFHEQIGEFCEITRPYYNRMLERAPELLAVNVNHWLNKDPKPRLIRTLDGKARAFLSNRYRTLDNWDMLGAILPPLGEAKMDFVSCEVTETRMYLKILFPKQQAEIKPGDVVRGGLVISNSEVGAGSFRVEPFAYRLVCSNGLIAEAAMAKYHIGGANQVAEGAVREILSDKTKAQVDAALFASVRDVVRHSLTEVNFGALMDRFRVAAGHKIEGSPIKAVEVVGKKYGFTDKQGEDVLTHLLQGGDLSQWGLANAVTRTAQDQKDYDTETWFERTGGRIIELPKKDWQVISLAN